MKLILLCLFSIPAVLSRDFEYDEAIGDSETLPAGNITDPRGHRPTNPSEETEAIQQVFHRNEPSTRRHRHQNTGTPQAQKAHQRTFDNDKGGCLFIGNEMGVLCPNGCELRTALLKDEQNMMPIIKNLKLQVSNLSQSSRTINIYVERVDNEMYRRESQYLGNDHILNSYSTELEERFSLIKEKVTQTLPSSIRVMRSLVDSLKEKLKNLERAVMVQKEYCAHPCVVSCNIPVVSGKECNDIYEKGGRTSQLYLIQPDSFKQPYKVYCDMITEEGGWTLIQNRQDGSVGFGRSWDAYKNGFGNIAYDSGKGFCDTPGEYWLGNDRISQLTKMKTTELLFEMHDWNDDSVKAHFSKFVVQSEVNKYRLSVNGYSGVAGNTLIEGAKSLFGINRTMTIHQDMMFSTYDRDNDGWEPENPTKQCSREDGGGWWYNRCHSANPNGRYYVGGEYSKEITKHGTDDGIVWMDWKGSWYSLKKMSMKIRPQFTSTMPDQEQIPMQFLTP
ncbi:fibrinogen beta chain [Mobula birostris]|uniref:fibrinogen beta chain n=1 Tax=Mobula birostris TaxID=1983395 RepID=UPI003B28A806